MPGIEVEIEILGLKELQKKLGHDVMLGAPLKKILGQAALILEREAKKRATGRPGPMVQTGRLRASITSTISSQPVPPWAKVGTNVKYAPYVEFGHKQKVGRYVKAIGKRLVNPMAPAYPFLFPAYEAMKSKIDELLDKAAKIIEDRFGK